MQLRRSSYVMIVVLSAIQVLGPGTLWAAEERGVRLEESRQVVIAAIDGPALTVQRGNDTKLGQFREAVNVGERLVTDNRTMAELLIGSRALVTLGPGTTAQFLTVTNEQAVIQVNQGLVRVAAAPSKLGPQGAVTVQTPTGQVQTHGGIVRVQVEAKGTKAERQPTSGAYAYHVSSVPERMAAASPLGELIQVDEGTAEILQNGGKPVMLQAGQRVALQGGKAGPLSESVNQDSMRPGVVATVSHQQTPKEGREFLVALQIDQATKLTDRLIDPNRTNSGDADKKSDTKNVINGATGGVALQNNLVSALFGTGSAASSSASIAQDRTGNGYGGVNSNGSFGESLSPTSVSLNSPNSLLTYTRKDPIELVVKNGEMIMVGGSTFSSGDLCSADCLEVNRIQVLEGQPDRVEAMPLESNTSNIAVRKELVLIGGNPNEAHGGIAPKDTLIIRGLGRSNLLAFNDSFTPTDRSPSLNDDTFGAPDAIVAANNTFVVENDKKFSNIVDETIPDGQGEEQQITRYLGGTLGQYSGHPDKRGRAFEGEFLPPASFVDGAITATTASDRPRIILKGGASLDQGTTATIGTTTATDTYFKSLTTNLGRTFSGSLLSVIDGPNGRTSLTMQNRMLGVYDGSMISGGDPTCKAQACNKALLSVLDAKLNGPGSSIPLIDIAAGTHFDRDGNQTPGSRPDVKVTTALVTRSTIPLDGALLEASAPLFALTQAEMTTTNHFADLAGNQAQSLKLGDALVALDASKLIINSGHLLNLNNATAAIGGYLFSLTNSSSLTLSDGALFGLKDGSALTLNGNAFGVFGSGTPDKPNVLTINNDMCKGACGALFNSANQPITLPDGTPLKVSGVTQNVVLPNGFNVFAGNASTAKVNIDANDALFHMDPSSTLTINGTKVK